MGGKILCVAEKNSISKAVAGHLSGGSYETSNTAYQYIKNYTFTYNFGPPWGQCDVVMTCVSGHLTEVKFASGYDSWEYPPPSSLFNAPVQEAVSEDKQNIALNIQRNARGARALFIWTDCDREGEHIGGEVRTEALKGNPSLQIKRARFSNIERAHILHAARNPVDLDERQIWAVAARTELDLRTGYAFTRYWTNSLRPLGGPFSAPGPDGRSKVFSYGSCQFPTLGFVVDRYLRVKNFVPEPFWSIKVTHVHEDLNVVFNWRRNRLFDRAAVVILFEMCITAKTAKVVKIQEKPTKKWKPLPLTTVEMQKMASRFLHMNSQESLKAAEELYNKGFISYPRTETDRFDKGMNLRALVEKQTQDSRWGTFAQTLAAGGFQQPREGRHDDKAHPPIHPVQYCTASAVNINERRLYEFITRRFLACCSEDAKGQSTDVEIEYGEEFFNAHGLVVLERNYLDVYPYDKWTSSSNLPKFTLGEQFEPTEAMITEGATTAPGYLSEPDLIALMDANGIGTDATMAEHIAKIKERGYVIAQPKAGGQAASTHQSDAPARGGRGGRGSRGGGRGGSRGGAAATSVSGGGGGSGAEGVLEFIPTTLGVALVEGHDQMGFEISLSKPFLRKEMEARMKDICEGRMTREAVIRACVRQYKAVFEQSEHRLDVLKASCRKYVLNNSTAA